MNSLACRLRLPRALAAAVAFTAAACTAATAPDRTSTNTPGGEISLHRQQWQAQKITTYQFDFRQAGFFIACTGPLVSVHVTNGAVDAVTDLATGESLVSRGCWPTIDQLFERADAAQQAGSLTAIEFDSVLGYPTRIELAGPPDASGSDIASNLRATP